MRKRPRRACGGGHRHQAGRAQQGRIQLQGDGTWPPSNAETSSGDPRRKHHGHLSSTYAIYGMTGDRWPPPAPGKVSRRRIMTADGVGRLPDRVCDDALDPGGGGERGRAWQSTGQGCPKADEGHFDGAPESDRRKRLLHFGILSTCPPNGAWTRLPPWLAAGK